MDAILILAIVMIGFSAGLRTFTAPAVVAWSAYAGGLDLAAAPLGFMASPVAVAILTLFALGECVADVLPGTPARTAWPGLIARAVTGSFSAACLLAASGQNYLWGIVGGAVAVAGAFTGYQARTKLVEALRVKDPFIAITEDLATIGIAVGAIYLAL